MIRGRIACELGIEMVLGQRELGEALVPMPIVQRGSVRALDARSGVADR